MKGGLLMMTQKFDLRSGKVLGSRHCRQWRMRPSKCFFPWLGADFKDLKTRPQRSYHNSMSRWDQKVLGSKMGDLMLQGHWWIRIKKWTDSGVSWCKTANWRVITNWRHPPAIMAQPEIWSIWSADPRDTLLCNSWHWYQLFEWEFPVTENK